MIVSFCLEVFPHTTVDGIHEWDCKKVSNPWKYMIAHAWFYVRDKKAERSLLDQNKELCMLFPRSGVEVLWNLPSIPFSTTRLVAKNCNKDPTFQPKRGCLVYERSASHQNLDRERIMSRCSWGEGGHLGLDIWTWDFLLTCYPSKWRASINEFLLCLLPSLLEILGWIQFFSDNATFWTDRKDTLIFFGSTWFHSQFSFQRPITISWNSQNFFSDA